MKDDVMTAARHGLSPIGCADVEEDWAKRLIELIERETTHTYTTHGERAAYRAGMSTSAMICDAFARELRRPRGSAAVEAGNEIMRLRDLVKVPRQELDASRDCAIGEAPCAAAVNNSPSKDINHV